MMRGKFKFAITIIVVLTIGCKTTPKDQISINYGSLPALADNVNESLQPQSAASKVELSKQRFDPGPLSEFNFNDPGSFLRLSLDQCIENALSNSLVVRELGGTALRSPELMITANDAAIAYTDPVIGEEAALSEFDATFANQFAFQNNDRSFNSSFIGDQGRLDQKLATNSTRLSKRSATGTLFQISNQVVYDFNNTPANRFTNNVAYDTFLETELRQPLLQGGGVLFNRIAGPNNRPGVNNGVLIARTNTDISLAEFELGIRNLVSEVENAYWDLYFAYRDLESKVEARNGAYKIWESLRAQGQDKKTSEILQAEEQYYLFASRVKDAIHGQLNDGTRTFNGSSSGTFRGNAGVRVAERRLRLIAGYAVNEGLLIVPQDMPIEAQVVFDWEQVKTDALTKRTELRRQRWVLKREELNLIANKNFLLPRVDLVGKYRVRGFGNDLFGNTGFDPLVAPAADAQDGSAAYRTFLDGDLQEWEFGMDINIPIGYRRQWAAVRNSELAFTRQKKILLEQERQIVYGLSNSLGEVQRTSSLREVNARRLDASKRQYTAIQEDFDNDDTTINLVLESQRRVIDAKLDYFKTQVEFMLAIKSVHFEKGTMLQYHNVTLTENGWTIDDYREAMERENNKSRPLNYFFPGLMISSPLDQPQIGFVGPEPEFLTKQKAKAKSDEMFANDDKSTDPISEKSDVEANAAEKISAKTEATESLKASAPDSVLLGIAKNLDSHGKPSAQDDHDQKNRLVKINLQAKTIQTHVAKAKPVPSNPQRTDFIPQQLPTMPAAASVIGNFGDMQKPQTPQARQSSLSIRSNRRTDSTNANASSTSTRRTEVTRQKTRLLPTSAAAKGSFGDTKKLRTSQPNQLGSSSRLQRKTVKATTTNHVLRPLSPVATKGERVSNLPGQESEHSNRR